RIVAQALQAIYHAPPRCLRPPDALGFGALDPSSLRACAQRREKQDLLKTAAKWTEACRRQWRKQAGGTSGIARSACATMRVPRKKGFGDEIPKRVLGRQS
ncbi:MAG: hypothetical protein IJ418_08730, partial [Clostridia bacterium]|nr:hypothetical protein [Clostridia bacterium]